MKSGTWKAPDDARTGFVRPLLVGAGVVFLLLGSLELIWRGQGHRPASIDNLELWALNRRKASSGDANTVVLVGSSRIQASIDPDVFVRETGMQKPVVLASGWAAPLPVLRDLAEDSDFRGVILCSILPIAVFSEHSFFEKRSMAQVAFARRLRPSESIEYRLKDKYHNVFALSVYSLWNVILPEIFLDRRSIEFPGFLNSDRYHQFDSRKIRDKRHMQRGQLDNFNRFVKPPGPEAMRHLALRYRSVGDQLRNKGVKIVFIRVPSSGPLLYLEKRAFPRKRYWDRLLKLSGVRGIHFFDHPALESYNQPDFSHISWEERARFTRALAPILMETLDAPRSP